MHLQRILKDLPNSPQTEEKSQKEEKTLFTGAFVTVYKGNPQMMRDCPVQQPVNTRLYSRLSRTATRK